MEDEIEVNEYVRTKDGYIAKVIEIDTRYFWFDNLITKNSGIPVCEINKDTEIKIIVKHSKNLIDLIETRRLRKWLQSRRNS